MREKKKREVREGEMRERWREGGEGGGGREGGDGESEKRRRAEGGGEGDSVRVRLRVGRHPLRRAATVNVRTQEAVEVLAVCLYHKEKVILESRALFQKFNTRRLFRPFGNPSAVSVIRIRPAFSFALIFACSFGGLGPAPP